MSPRRRKGAWSDGHTWGSQFPGGRLNHPTNTLLPGFYPTGNVDKEGKVRSVTELGYDPAKLAEIRQRAIARHRAAATQATHAIEQEVHHRHSTDEARADEVIREDAAEYNRLIAEQDEIDTPDTEKGWGAQW